MSSKTILVTGVNGFVGQHLVNELVASNHNVIGIGRDEVANSLVADRLASYHSSDLSKEWPETVGDIDAIIHLAGLAAVGPSFDNPQRYIDQNSAMVTNMCEYYMKKDKKPRIVIVSSGAVYNAAQPMPINESGPISFGSPYAISKVLNENQAAYYNSRGFECVVMRPFNHIGPGQSQGFIVPDLAKKISDTGLGENSITAGNLTSKRDYTDVRDVARAYRLVATSPEPPRELIYNVCLGDSHSGEEVLALASKALGAETPTVTIDEKLLRPNDTPDIRGDSSSLQDEFGWKPEFTFEQSIVDFVASLNTN